MLPLKPSFLRYFIYNNAFVSAMDTLAAGTLLTTYALALGAAPLLVGVLGGLPYVGTLVNTLGAYLVYKGGDVKKITLEFSFASRFFYLVCAALALMPGIKYAAVWLVMAIALCYLTGGVSAGAYYPWLKTFLPEKQTHLFVERKYIASMSAHIAGFVFAFLLMKHVSDAQGNPPVCVYAVIFLAAFMFGILGTGCLWFVPQVPPQTKNEIPAKKQVRLMWNQYKGILVICAAALGVLFFTATFIPVFALQVGNISVTAITALALVGQVGFLLSLPLWKCLNEKTHSLCSTQLAFIIIGLLLVCVTIFLPWLTGTILKGTAGVLFVISFISKAGILAGLDATILLQAPKDSSSVFFAVVSWVKLTAALGPALAGGCWMLLTYFNQSEVTTNWQIFFTVSFLGSLAVAGLCTLVHKKFR